MGTETWRAEKEKLLGVEDYFKRLRGWARANLLPVAVLLGLILTVGLWFASPIFHGLFIGFYANWSFWVLVVLGVVVVVVLLNRGYRRPATLVAGAWVLFLFFFLIFGGALEQVRFYNSLEAETISEIPETKGVRFLPLEIASRAAQNRCREDRTSRWDTWPHACQTAASTSSPTSSRAWRSSTARGASRRCASPSSTARGCL
jgi:hypothetical protein